MESVDIDKTTKVVSTLTYSIPDIQRKINNGAVGEIYSREKTFYEARGRYLLPGVVSLCRLTTDNTEYVIDGQHRLAAYKMLARDFPEREMIIRVDNYCCDNVATLEELYKLVNTSTPNEISRMEIDVYKIKQEILGFFSKQFPLYIKTTSRPIPPNINLSKLSDKLDLIELKQFALGEFPILAMELNKFYSQVSPEMFAKWKVPAKSLEAVRQKPNQLFLGVYKEYEWIFCVFRAKRGEKYSQMEHYSSTFRGKITTSLRVAVWGSPMMTQPCYCCGDIISYEKFECGHIIPVCFGGATNKENLRPVCSTCNSDMGVMNMDDYKKLLGEQI